MESVFRYLPERFFSPLASLNREHYAELLLVFYQLFQEYPLGVERERAVAAFEEYIAGLGSGGMNADPEDIGETGQVSGDDTGRSPDSETTSAHRLAAGMILRKLIACGWLTEEELSDFRRVLGVSTHAKPFFEALRTVSLGNSVEYESHVVAVYSSLCSDSAMENGEYAVLNAHFHTRMLIESLKVLEQNIRRHIQGIYGKDTEIRDILHIHYDLYMNEVVDRAYHRLKTSDNLSKYRPKIHTAVSGFLENDAWLARTSERLSTIRRIPVRHAEQTIREMLKEIRSDLRSIDPILESIDDKNRRYSRISTERIRSRLYSDTTLQGKIGTILKAWRREDLPEDLSALPHRVFRQRYLDAGSLYIRRAREVDSGELRRPAEGSFDIEQAEAELRLRVMRQLNPSKIAAFLADFCPTSGVPVPAEVMVNDMESYIRVLYAAAYAGNRASRFPYEIHWHPEGTMTTVGRFTFRKHSFVRRRTDA